MQLSGLKNNKNGEKYSLFYLKMCLKSIKLGGFLIRQVGTILIPYDKNSLADLTKTDVDTVVVAMRIIKRNWTYYNKRRWGNLY